MTTKMLIPPLDEHEDLAVEITKETRNGTVMLVMTQDNDTIIIPLAFVFNFVDVVKDVLAGPVESDY